MGWLSDILFGTTSSSTPKEAIGNPRHSYWSDFAIRSRGGNPRSSEYSDLAIRCGKEK